MIGVPGYVVDFTLLTSPSHGSVLAKNFAGQTKPVYSKLEQMRISKIMKAERRKFEL